jgi:hypothetical protein
MIMKNKNKLFNDLINDSFKSYKNRKDYNPLIDTREKFIDRIKLDKEFSKKCGIKIKEKKVDLEERRSMVTQKMFNEIYSAGSPETLSDSECDQWNIPKKKIILTHKINLYI